MKTQTRRSLFSLRKALPLALTLAALGLLAPEVRAWQTVLTPSSNSISPLSIPSVGVSLKIEMFGGGGGGGGVAVAGSGTTYTGGGGGGGAYTVTTISSPSSSYAFSVGAGGTGGASTAGTRAGAGGSTTFGTAGVTTTTATGGTGGVGGGSGTPNGGGGGGGTNTTGLALFTSPNHNGGNGGTAVSGQSGSGGGSGSASADGGNGSGSATAGGTAGAGGGAGGVGKTGQSVGSVGNPPGGGAGGAFVNNSTAKTGSKGGDGQIVLSQSITYYTHGNGDPTDVNNWYDTTSGGGNHPASFTGADIFVIQSGHTMTATVDWAVNNTGALAGTPLTTGSLTINSGGKLDMNGHALSVGGIAFINNGTYASGSAVAPITFTSSGTFTPGVSTVGVAVIGGGGGGGDAGKNTAAVNVAGGGGGGGCYYVPAQSVTAGTSYTVTVGTGGAGSTSSTVTGTTGGNSVFTVGSTVLTGTGGGGGGSMTTGGVGGAAGAGGVPTGSGGTAFNGGTGSAGGTTSVNLGGGGGGAGAGGAGTTATTTATGGAGGAGISGAAAGGQGGTAVNSAAGGSGSIGLAYGGGGAGGAEQFQSIASGTNAFAGSAGTNGAVVFFYPNSSSPTISTPTKATPGTTTNQLGATLTGNGGSSVTDYGVVWATTPSPTTANNKVQVGTTDPTYPDVYTVSVTVLPVNTQIYYGGYAVNAGGTAYSTYDSFWTLANTPTVPAVANPATLQNSTLNVTIGSADGNPVSTTYYAIQCTNSPASYVQANGFLSGSAVYQTANTWGQVTVSGLSPGITYGFQVIASNNAAGTFTAPGPVATGTTSSSSSAPAVTTAAASSITTTSATLNGTVNNGGAALTDYGFYWSTTSPVTTSSTQAQVGTSDYNGAYTKSLTGLSANTQYYYRAYAGNGIGSSLDNADVTFWTLANTPAAPTVVNPATLPNSTLNVIIGVGDGNPGTTIYAITNVGAGTFVQANGSLGATAVYQTKSTWGTVTVTGLNGGTAYTFAVIAINGVGVQTVSGSSASATTTSYARYQSRASGNWSDYNTWSVDRGNGSLVNAISGETPSSITGNGTNILIVSPYNVTNDVASSAVNLTVNHGATLTVSGGVLTVSHSMVGAPDLDVHGTLNLSYTNALTFSSGGLMTLESDGALHHINRGTVVATNNTPTLTFNGHYYDDVADTNSTIPTATWSAGSICEITGYTTTYATAPGGIAQSFGNFTWNCPSMAVNVNMTTSFTNIQGDFNYTSGSGQMQIHAGGNVGLSVGGNMNVLAGTLVGMSGNGTIVINVTGNVNVSATATFALGGATTSGTTVNVLGNVSNAGTISAFAGSSKIQIIHLAKGSGTQTYSGSGTVTGPVAWTVDSGSTLDLGTSVITDSSGTFTNLSGGGLKTAHANGFAGNIIITTVNLSTGGNYTYKATSGNQSGDTLLPATVNSLTIANSGGGKVSLNQNETVTNLTVASGANLDFNSKSISTPNAPIFSGALTMEVTRTGVNTFTGSTFTQTSGTLTYGGTLSVTLSSGTLAGGDIIPLFSAPAYAGGFTSVTPPVQDGYIADYSALQSVASGGSITIRNAQNHFYQSSDNGYGGDVGLENLIYTATSGTGPYYVWSSTNPSLPVTQWTPEGSMSEFPIANTPNSHYGITVTPGALTTYYICAHTNAGPYTAQEPLLIMTTSDFFFFFGAETNLPISSAGVFQFGGTVLTPLLLTPGSLKITGTGASAAISFGFTNASGLGFSVLAQTNPALPAASWSLLGAAVENPAGSGHYQFTDPAPPTNATRFYLIRQP